MAVNTTQSRLGSLGFLTRKVRGVSAETLREGRRRVAQKIHSENRYLPMTGVAGYTVIEAPTGTTAGSSKRADYDNVLARAHVKHHGFIALAMTPRFTIRPSRSK